MSSYPLRFDSIEWLTTYINSNLPLLLPLLLPLPPFFFLNLNLSHLSLTPH